MHACFLSFFIGCLFLSVCATVFLYRRTKIIPFSKTEFLLLILGLLLCACGLIFFIF